MVTEEGTRAPLLRSVFTSSDEEQATAAVWWSCTKTPRPKPSPALSGPVIQAQLAAAGRFSGQEHREEGLYDRLHEIKIPSLVANGNNDILVPTHTSYMLWKGLVSADASLHLYPDSGNGVLDAYRKRFAGLVNEVLEGR